VEYEMETEIVKVESLFHHEYTSQPIIVPTSSRRKTNNKNRKMEENGRKDEYALRNNHHHHHHHLLKQERNGPVQARAREKLPKSVVDISPHQTGSSYSYKNRHDSNGDGATIDLTLDDDEDDGREEDANMEGHPFQRTIVNPLPTPSSSHHSLYRNHHNDEGSKNSCVDLTVSTDDEQEDLVPPPPHSDNEPEQDDVSVTTATATATAITTSARLRRAPKVVLWISTPLLGPRVFEPKALFQFTGDVVYKDIGGRGRWVLQARTARLMDGLDLYSYRQAILLTRDLVQQKAKEKEQRQSEQRCMLQEQ